MALVAPVNLPYNIKTLWFDPEGLELSHGQKVVVKTARGLELGVMASDIKEVGNEEVESLKSPLMPVMRIATEEDLARAKELEEKARDAMVVFKKYARETSEDMHPVSVEFMLDGEKGVFYFESEERIDFRELVRRLASEFHVRIDMRQIGVRDEARIVGGIAHCGQMVCCKRLGGEFKPVSIRMAKEQDMSLNPQKISGLCGRLMCCLRYESELYGEFKKMAPKQGAQISTPDGMGKVVEIDVPKESVTIKIADEKPVSVPVAKIGDLSEDRKSGRIDDDDWAEIMEEAKSDLFDGSGLFNLPKFTTDDQLGDAKAVHHEKPRSKSGNKSSSGAGSSSKKSRGPKRRSLKISLGASEKSGDGEDASNDRKSPSRKGQSGDSGRKDRRRKDSGRGSKKGQSKSDSSKNADSGASSKLRPGHKSSGLTHASDDGAHSQNGGEQSEKRRNSRRRRRRSGSNKASKGQNQSQGTDPKNS